jgi:hypothetical protein
MASAGRREKKFGVQLLFKWWEVSFGACIRDHTQRPSFSRAAVKREERFERSKLGLPRMKNSVRTKSICRKKKINQQEDSQIVDVVYYVD